MFRRTLVTIVLLTSVGVAYAVPFQTGDVFAAVANGQIQHWRPGVGLQATYNTGQGGFTTGMAFDSSGNLYVTNFDTGTITRFDSNGNVIAPNPFVTNDPGAANESIVFDAAGNFYVGQALGSRDIIKRAADGTFLQRYDVAAENLGSDWIDLAADQQTMYYTSEGRLVKRYDVSTDTQLADFAVLPGSGTAFALRFLGDGGLLVADTSDIKRLNALGNVIQTYDVASHDAWFALNLDPDGTSFWSGDFVTGQFHQFDIASGAVLDSEDTGKGAGALFGLTVFGERTAGVPTPEPATVTLMGLGLAALGLLAWRRQRH